MVSEYLNSIANTRSEAVFLPPALLGYIGYIENSLMILGITALVVLGGAILHEFLEITDEISSEEDDLELADIIACFPSSTVAQILFGTAILVFVISMLLAPLYAVWLFHQTHELYLGAGIFLYLIWIVKLGNWVGMPEDITENQQAAIEYVEEKESD